MMQLACERASRCTNFDPGGSHNDEKVGKFAQSKQSTAQYQAERSTDITRQCKRRVRRFSFDIRVFQLREKHLCQTTQNVIVYLTFILTSSLKIALFIMMTFMRHKDKRTDKNKTNIYG